MAPTRAEEDDPVVAEYDVYITAPAAEQILLSQYPNRERARPYPPSRDGLASRKMRIKPESGHVEVELDINPEFNFNKLASLKWGDALGTARELHNKSATFGPAAGFHPAKPKGLTARTVLKPDFERNEEIDSNLLDFDRTEREGKAMTNIILGGQLVKHGEKDDSVRPNYFVGAFRGAQLHLTKVDGTVQLRPQFPYLDAEDERNRLQAFRSSAAETEGPASLGNPRSLLQRAKTEHESDKGRFEDRMRRMLQAAEAEEWTPVDYIESEYDSAFATFNDRMFVKDVEAVPKLKSGMDGDQYLDAISLPRRESPTRSRKRPPRRKKEVEDEDEDAGEEG